MVKLKRVCKPKNYYINFFFDLGFEKQKFFMYINLQNEKKEKSFLSRE